MSEVLLRNKYHKSVLGKWIEAMSHDLPIGVTEYAANVEFFANDLSRGNGYFRCSATDHHHYPTRIHCLRRREKISHPFLHKYASINFLLHEIV